MPKRRGLASSGGFTYEPGQAGRSNPKYMGLCSGDTGLSRGIDNPARLPAAILAPAASKGTLMARVLKADDDAVRECAKALASGMAIVYPTETVYGLGVDATNKQAVRRLIDIKARDPRKPVSVAVASVSEAMELAEFSRMAQHLAEKFLPGPMTLVLKPKRRLPLIAPNGKIGIRISSHDFVQKLLHEFKKPITATSANISGLGSASNASAVDTRIWEKVSVVVNDQQTQYKKESTVVDASGKSPKILREGAISNEEIKAALGS